MTVVNSTEMVPIVASAPGKIIIFGEHSAVYGKPAMAASVSSLRSYLYVKKTEDESVVEMAFPDINSNYSWPHKDLEEIDRQQLTLAQESNDVNNYVMEFVRSQVSGKGSDLEQQAAVCFLYLYMCLCPNLKGVRFILKSTLPIGAGLGSSASIAVCLALAMAKLGGHLDAESKELSSSDLEFVNKWSFIAEKCNHGTPSGIDNAVATYGNAVVFRRQEDGSTTFEPIKEFPQVPMVLTNTKIPKSTKVLVANVRKLFEREPVITSTILEAMSAVATKAKELLPAISSDPKRYTEMLELVRINHGLLVSLGVSHPGLEVIKSLSDSTGIGSTKLTGAGGGGCAFTLLKTGTTDEAVTSFIETLSKNHGYESFTTELGGLGCCFVAPDSLAAHASEIAKLFEEESTIEELNNALLPGSSALNWVVS
ncbi:HBL317Wp [Eremothecium sinecaudum]|uniref:Mevalonate kinase n=1 Tax=Eremothecium sinecaudum TaxID=45286 RepID=A0A120K0R0_9SACH|nr:HBL317Wp [Eremothecium sinecaudum]AMD18585.1 HBL317Wp [Eremothecium sinecaudum]